LSDAEQLCGQAYIRLSSISLLFYHPGDSIQFPFCVGYGISPIAPKERNRMKLNHLPPPAAMRKAPSGIAGFDEITGGGLPLGRTALLVGGPGCAEEAYVSAM
jgi:hypothetical protein